MSVKSANHKNNPGSQSETCSGKTVGYSINDVTKGVSKGLIEASGGTEFTEGDYHYHVFTSTSNLTITNAPSLSSLQYVIVGGGGNSNNPVACGGAGAGGYVTGTSSKGQIGIGTHLITVGGAGSNSQIFDPSSIPGPGTREPASSNDITTIALAGGADAQPGGSGGGGPGFGGYSAASGTQGQGKDGASGYDSGQPYYYRNGGGGGGAGGNGSPGHRPAGSPSPIPANCGWGGDGKALFNGDPIPASFGTPGSSPGRWVAGGGATAGAFSSGVDASGGYGGGGSNSPTSTKKPTSGDVRNGQVNTGGGASGGPVADSTGGSGIVILRYTLSADYNYPALSPA